MQGRGLRFARKEEKVAVRKPFGDCWVLNSPLALEIPGTFRGFKCFSSHSRTLTESEEKIVEFDKF